MLQLEILLVKKKKKNWHIQKLNLINIQKQIPSNVYGFEMECFKPSLVSSFSALFLNPIRIPDLYAQ